MRILATLLAALALTALVPANPDAACATAHADTSCLRALSSVESAALERAIAALERTRRGECRVLASFIRQNANDARILPYPIRTPYGVATGDAHVVEDPRGTGRVHVADSVWTRDGALGRPVEAKIRSLVHDFAHLALDLPQFTFHLRTDAADDAIARCLDF